jgi:hypothetical protein
VQKSLVDEGLGENVLGEMSDSGSEIDWDAEERKADLEEAGSREAMSFASFLNTNLLNAHATFVDFQSPRTD